MELTKKVRNAFWNAEYLIDGKKIEINEYLHRNVDFLIEKLTAEHGAQRGLLLHLGTGIPFYLAVVIAALKAYLTKDQSSVLDVLNDGDKILILSEKKRGVYKGIDDEGRIVVEYLERGRPLIHRMPVQKAKDDIIPYHGKAKKLDGRGLRISLDHTTILSNLLSIETDKIRRFFNNSVIVVCDRSDADRLAGQLFLSVCGKSVRLSELFPSTYYTEGEKYPYPGNSAGTEPLLKFTSRLSVAREMIVEDDRIDTLIIGRERYFVEDISELQSLFERASLKSILLMGVLHRSIESPLLDKLQREDLLIWTEDRVRNVSISKQQNRDDLISDESKRLNKLIQNLNNKKTNHIKINSLIPIDRMKRCKEQLHELSQYRNKESNPDINRFIVGGYLILNLFERSIFPLNLLEDLIAEGVVRATSPKEELKQMQFIASNVSDPSIRSKMEEITRFLYQAYEALLDDNPKFQFLKQFLYNHRSEKIAVVVNRSYYEVVFRKANSSNEHLGKWDITTLNRLRDDKFYDFIVFAGLNNWRSVNPLLLNNAREFFFLLYFSEIFGMNYLVDHTKRRIMQYLDNAPNETDGAIIAGMETDVDIDHQQYYEVEKALEKFVDEITAESSIGRYAVATTSSNPTSRIYKIAYLDSDEKVFFTRFYSAYVYDSVKGSVIETNVSDLKVGDKLLFPVYGDETRDIVEKIMDMIVENGKNDRLKKYRLAALYWKRALIKYMKSHGLTYRELSNKLNKLGLKKHEVTLRSWLDKDSRIVGPREVKSFRAVAKLTQDPKLLKNPDFFWRACCEVRKMRIRILRFIGKNIVRTYGREDQAKEDELLSQLPIDVSKMTRLVEIVRIVDTDQQMLVASSYANRPLSD
jgi:hypothetical protein